MMVSSNVGGVNEEKSIVKNVHADDWTAELATIASNVVGHRVRMLCFVTLQMLMYKKVMVCLPEGPINSGTIPRKLPVLHCEWST